MSTIRITYTEKNPIINARIKVSIDKKKEINECIREGKDLKKLNDKGIKFRMPI